MRLNQEIPVWLVGGRAGLGHDLYGVVAQEGLEEEGMVRGQHFEHFVPFEQGARLERVFGTGMAVSYQFGGWGRAGKVVYRLLRSSGKSEGKLTRLVTKINRDRFRHEPVIAVATQSLSATYKPHDYVLNGDPIVDSAAENAGIVLVPTDEIAEELKRRGHDKRVIVSGWLVPNKVKDKVAMEGRLKRLQNGGRLTARVHFNDQTPWDHVAKVQRALPDLAPVMRGKDSGLQMIIFTATKAKLAERFARQGERLNLTVARGLAQINSDWDLLVLWGGTRREAVDLATETSALVDWENTMPKEILPQAAFIPQVHLFGATNINAAGCEAYAQRHRIAVLASEVGDFAEFTKRIVESPDRRELVEPWEQANRLIACRVDGGKVLALEIAGRLKVAGQL